MTHAWVPKIILCCLLSSCSFAQTGAGPLASVLAQRLDGKLLSLRVPTSGKKLHFDSNGTFVGKQEHGIASLDRDIVVTGVKVDKGAVTINGDRVYYSWDPKLVHLDASRENIEAEIRLDSPDPNVTEAAIAPVFTKVFLSNQEALGRECTKDEVTSFETLFDKGVFKLPVDDWSDTQTNSKADLTTVCLPPGERAYLPATAVHPPKIIHAADPPYSESAARSGIEGTAIYAVRVDENGLPTDALPVASLDPSLNFNGASAVRNWRFTPASINGEKIPIIIAVTVNFKRR